MIIAAAFLATLWGIMSANVMFLPIGKRVAKVGDKVAEGSVVLMLEVEGAGAAAPAPPGGGGRQPAAGPGAPAPARGLRRAIRPRRVGQIDYADAQTRPSTRRLRPLAIWAMEDGWMFSGWCELRADFRTWRFDRVTALELTDQVFPEDPDKTLATFLARDACEAARG